MVRTLILICLVFGISSCASALESQKNSSPRIILSDTQSFQDQIKFLDNKIDLLQSTADKNFDSERQNYNVNVAVMGVIVTFLLGIMGATSWYNLRIAREDFQEELDKSRKKLAEDVNTTTQKVIVSSDEKLDALEKNFEKQFLFMNAYNNDALGRIYETKFPNVSSLWFLRAVDNYIKGGGMVDDWVSNRLDWIIDNSKKPNLLDIPEEVKEEMEVILKKLTSPKIEVKVKEIKDLLSKIKTYKKA